MLAFLNVVNCGWMNCIKTRSEWVWLISFFVLWNFKPSYTILNNWFVYTRKGNGYVLIWEIRSSLQWGEQQDSIRDLANWARIWLDSTKPLYNFSLGGTIGKECQEFLGLYFKGLCAALSLCQKKKGICAFFETMTRPYNVSTIGWKKISLKSSITLKEYRLASISEDEVNLLIWVWNRSQAFILHD